MLAGIQVLDLGRLLPGGVCTLLLSDLGAEVVKVEQPGRGDCIRWMGPRHGDDSAGHLAVNRGKKSVALDLKDPRGALAFRQLAAGADVVVHSYRPGVMERLGLGADRLRDDNAGARRADRRQRRRSVRVRGRSCGSPNRNCSTRSRRRCSSSSSTR